MKKREIELDILRLLAMLAVIWVHIGGMESNTLPTSDPNCQWLIFLKSIMTWEIPVYIMISGRFFLDPSREMTFSKIGKAIGRLALAFIVWSAIYYIYYLATGAYGDMNWKGALAFGLIGPYHFWYLYMIVGLYLITPFLRKIAADRQLCEYFIILGFLFMFLAQYAPSIPLLGPALEIMLEQMNMKFVLGYSVYYVLGHYLHAHPLSGRCEAALYIFGGVLLLAGAGANTWQSFRDGVYTEWYTVYTAPNTIIAASAAYTFFVNRVHRLRLSERACRLIAKLSEYSFGVYLLHALVLNIFRDLGAKPTFLHPLLAMPLLTLASFAVTAAMVALLRKIPVIGRKIT